jgi:hypothetical protein
VDVYLKNNANNPQDDFREEKTGMDKAINLNSQFDQNLKKSGCC